ncbi:MAG: undecaprenyl-diphosphate phosphatase [Pseudomonadota bacterium]
MSILHLLIVAMIQGLTEFLPVSSSGHLILLSNVTGLDDQGQVIDVAVHVGTLGAVILYFWSDVKVALRGSVALLKWDLHAPGAHLALCLGIATVPVVLFGLVIALSGFDDWMRSDEDMRAMKIIGWTMLGFGLLLYWSDQRGATTRHATQWTIRHALAMGLWQAIALIPGTSRSGITITAGRMMGYDRESAARLAMLMSIPTILASGVFSAGEVAARADLAAARDATIAAILAFGAALAALWIMMRLLRSVSFTPYVIYRVLLGLTLLGIAYF